MFDQIFFSPQVKQSVIICNKYGILELLHELPNKSMVFARLLRAKLRDLGP